MIRTMYNHWRCPVITLLVILVICFNRLFDWIHSLAVYRLSGERRKGVVPLIEGTNFWVYIGIVLSEALGSFGYVDLVNFSIRKISIFHVIHYT